MAEALDTIAAVMPIDRNLADISSNGVQNPPHVDVVGSFKIEDHMGKTLQRRAAQIGRPSSYA
ncbi:hypothetical protein [Rhizobium etli]|uniref:hypothetical protein n=1 Tax=Rhizobium etli TaxID=29449 RepID=UPI00040F5068